jgi:hypothetical protein
MTTKSVQMEKRTILSGRDASGSDRRRPQRRRILGVLHDICLTIEPLQTTEDARLACREVAHMLRQAHRNDGVRERSKKS